MFNHFLKIKRVDSDTDESSDTPVLRKAMKKATWRLGNLMQMLRHTGGGGGVTSILGRATPALIWAPGIAIWLF